MRKGKDDFFQLSWDIFVHPVLRVHNLMSKMHITTRVIITCCTPRSCIVFQHAWTCAECFSLADWRDCQAGRLLGISPMSFCALGSLKVIRTWSGPNERNDYGSLFFVHILS